MESLYKLLSHFKISTTKQYKNIFDQMKTFLKTRLITLLDGLRKTNRGRKRTINLDQFLTCLFAMTDNGIKMSYTYDFFQLPRSTYYYYFDIITKNHFFESVYGELVRSYVGEHPIKYLITDTFTVKSMDGNEGLGRSSTDRGRQGFKVSLICDQNLITHAVNLKPANTHDSKILVPTIQSSINQLHGSKCLADAGYAGRKYIAKIGIETGVKLLPKPKKTSNKAIMSHYLSQDELELVTKKRNNIERLNGNIRNFRCLMIKYTKKYPRTQPICILPCYVSHATGSSQYPITHPTR
jgi:hypothetical protein